MREKTKLSGVFIIAPTSHQDKRGWFMESYNKKEMAKYGIDVSFVQDNHALSTKKGTLRGLHFQNNPMAQSKLVRCTRGALLDVVVDIRKNSPTYKEWVAVTLSAKNKKQIFIPKGFAHGYITLEPNTDIQYNVDAYYSPEHDGTIYYGDPELGIKWGSQAPILSDKDKNAPPLSESSANFI